MSKYQDYLFDLGRILRERAQSAVQRRNAAPRGSPDREFQGGRVIAFNEVISIMQQQAEGLGIPVSELQLDGVIPDRDLT